MLELAVRLLAETGGIPPVDMEALEAYCALVRRWNRTVSLVSQGDVDALEERHLVDALSLAPYCVKGEHLLDVGTGGGFPAIPLLIALPHLKGHLVERSAKKMGVLRNIVGELGLKRVRFYVGEFPKAADGVPGDVMTARAVEKPWGLVEAFAERLRDGGVLLCQSEDLGSGLCERGFHVEPITDVWSERGLRRGYLARVTL